MNTITPICNGCGKNPDQIQEYIDMGRVEEMTPTEFVQEEEGTYNKRNGHFWCTECYTKAGMPLGIAP